MWDKLEGYKTIATSAVGLVTALAAIWGYMDEATAKEVGTLIIPLALIFLRMGVKKAEPKA